MEELGPILIVGIVIVIIWYWRTHVAFKTTKDNPQPDHDKSSAKQQPRIEQVAMQPSQPTPDLDQILNGIMDQLLQLTGAERGYISLRGPEANAAEVRVAWNVEPQQTEMKIVEHVFESKQLLVTTNAAEDSRFSSQESVVSYALRSMMAVPLEIEGEVLGVMYVDKRVKAGLFSNNDMEPISQLAKQAAMLIRTKQVEVSSQSSADAIPALSVSTAVTPATIEQPTVPSLAAPESKPETDSPALSTSPVDKQAKSVGSLLRRIERGNQQGASKEKPLDSEEQSRLNAMRQQRRLQMPVVGQASSTSASGYAELRDRVKTKLLSELDSSLDMHSSDSRSTIEELFNAILAEENIVL